MAEPNNQTPTVGKDKAAWDKALRPVISRHWNIFSLPTWGKKPGIAIPAPQRLLKLI